MKFVPLSDMIFLKKSYGCFFYWYYQFSKEKMVLSIMRKPFRFTVGPKTAKLHHHKFKHYKLKRN